MDIAQPPKCPVRIMQDGNDLVLRWRVGSSAWPAIPLLLLAGCTAPCVVWTGELIREPTVEHVLWCLPFWSLWVGVAFLTAAMFFGSEGLRIGPDGVEYRYRILIGLGRRQIPLEEVRAVEPGAVLWNERGKRSGLIIETWGKPIRIGQPIDPSAGLWLAGLVHRHLQGLSPGRVILLRADEAVRASMQVEVLRPEGIAREPPSDSEIELRQDWDRTEFIARRTFALGAFVGVVLLNFVVNGFIAIWVHHVIRKPQDWPMLLILVGPWGLASFALIGIWMRVWAGPFWRRTWTIGRGALTARTSIFGIGRTRHYDLFDVDRIELRRGSGEQERKWSLNGQEVDRPFALGLVGRGGRDLLVIGGLTEGEARWMGGRLLETLPGSLPKDARPLPAEGPGPLFDLERPGSGG
jgi:hypothetical protein